MLATTGVLPAGTGWGFELKWDGVRAIAAAGPGGTRLYARSGAEITVAYPELRSLGTTIGRDAVLDGEIVLLDPAGHASFALLAERMHVRDAAKATRLAAARPVTYVVFDVLALDGTDLTGQPYAKRRQALESLGLTGDRWLVPPVFDDGPATMAASREFGAEGVVAKRLTSPYRPGVRSPDWIKVKHDVTGDFVVGGFRPGARTVGALLIGVPQPHGLAFRGRVGGGISAAAERALLAELRPRVIDRSPFATVLPREDSRDATWVRPEVVVEIRYGQRTPDQRLRFPRFVRLRPDKRPEEVSDEA
ncbi:MAG TPA: non-homologous end-joining DNA ligase [Micromonosporaceae bacterium]